MPLGEVGNKVTNLIFLDVETRGELLSLQWPAPPRNVLLVRKDCAPTVTDSLIEFAKYLILSLFIVQQHFSLTVAILVILHRPTRPLPSFLNPRRPLRSTIRYHTLFTRHLQKRLRSPTMIKLTSLSLWVGTVRSCTHPLSLRHVQTCPRSCHSAWAPSGS